MFEVGKATEQCLLYAWFLGAEARLPCQRVGPEAEGSAAGGAPHRGCDMKVILLVEDDEPSVEVLTEMLKMSGYEVEAALTAQTAIEAMSRRRYDVVLTDLSMTGAAPGELVDRLLELQERSPMVIYSARMPHEIDAAAQRLGAVAALQKPASMDHLLDTLAWAADQESTP